MLIGSLLSAAYFVTLKIHFDNLQILDKALLLIRQNQWVHHGNAGSGVGFVPGSFLTAITALPMKLYFSPYSAMAVIWIFHLAAMLLLFDCLRQLKQLYLAVPLVIFFWLNPWRVELSELYNPAYLPLFSALHLWTSLKLNSEKNFWISILHVLSIGLAAQLHYSFALLLITSFLLWRFKLIQPHWGGIFGGVILTLLSLIPYFLTLLSNEAVNIEVARSSKAFIGRNFVLVYPVLKAVLYWLRYSSSYFGRHIFTEIRFDWISDVTLQIFVHYLFHTLKWVFAALTLFFSFKLNQSLWRKVTPKKPLSSNLTRLNITKLEVFEYYVFYLFCGMFIASGLSPVEFNHWHLILCFPALTLLMTQFFDQNNIALIQKFKRPILFAVSIVFIVHSFLGALGSRSHSYRNNFATDWQATIPTQ